MASDNDKARGARKERMTPPQKRKDQREPLDERAKERQRRDGRQERGKR